MFFLGVTMDVYTLYPITEHDEGVEVCMNAF